MAKNKDNEAARDIDQSLLKRAVLVELILHDGTHLTGSVYVPSSIALHNLFEVLPDFFHLHRESTDYYLVNKNYVSVCKIPHELE